MDAYEATKIVMSRIQTLDPENASKIMGYILIQDEGEKEVLRLAFCPEALLLSYINQAKSRLGLLNNSNSNNNNNPSNRPPSISFPQTSPRIIIPNNGSFHSNPSSPAAAFHRTSPSPRPFSYAAALNGSNNDGSASSSLNFYGGNEFFNDDPVDPIMSPSGRSDSLVFPYGEDATPHPHPFHRRSCSVNDAAFLSNMEDGGGFGWRPCMYFARGFCKNGSNCKFLHGDEGIDVGSPGKTGPGLDEVLRMKALQQQRLALMAASGVNHHPFTYNKCVDFLNESPRLSRCRAAERNEYLLSGLGSSSRQIYLTFPADSTFKEEDVSSYFSMFGPVQDVRIPYQQKRMFGFVTFVYPETVKLILAKGNPHFVCDSRVLVKPYKEKGKVAERKQQMERGDYSACLSPSAVESREHFDLPFGSRMLLSTQEMMLRRKLEQEVELQHAIELQGQRMMNLQLMDLKNNRFMPGSPVGVPISSPRQARLFMNENFSAPDAIHQETSAEFDCNQEAAKSEALSEANEKLKQETTDESSISKNKQQHVTSDDFDLPESLEHILPDNLFASPTKSAAESQSVFSQASDNSEAVKITSSNNTTSLPNSSPLTMASLNSCYFRMPRFSSGQEAVEM